MLNKPNCKHQRVNECIFHAQFMRRINCLVLTYISIYNLLIVVCEGYNFTPKNDTM
jgi:hypothetical protein